MADTTNIKVLADRQDIVNVADAIRAKTGSTNEMTLGAMATAISNIEPVLQSKSVTYTSNGTATVTPDAGYDGLSSVDVAVNVSGGSVGPVPICSGSIQTLPKGKFGINFGDVADLFSAYRQLEDMFIVAVSDPNGYVTAIQCCNIDGITLAPLYGTITTFGVNIDIVGDFFEDFTVFCSLSTGKISIYYVADLCI